MGLARQTGEGHIYVMDELAAQIVSITAHTTLTEFTAEEWDRLNETAHPFLSYAFLSALEQSGSVGEQTGWDVLFLAAREEGSNLLALCRFMSNITPTVNMFLITLGHMRLSGLAGATIPSC